MFIVKAKSLFTIPQICNIIELNKNKGRCTMKKNLLILSILTITSLMCAPVTTKANILETPIMNETETSNYYNFISIDPTDSVNSDFKTPFKKIDTTIYEASIVGRGTNGKEEGISTVLIKNTKTNSYSEFKLDTNTSSTAINVTCGTDDTIFITVGYAYGRLTHGGDLYSLNLKTQETKLVASAFHSKEQIVDAKLNDNELTLTCYAFDDDFMNYISYTRTVSI